MIATAEGAIDPFGSSSNPGAKFDIGAETGPTGLGQLDERELAPILRIELEQLLHREELLLDALGVIESIDTDGDPNVILQ